MISLADSDKRFRELQKHMTGITSKVLSAELKDLERNNLITRKLEADTGVVFYALTHKCGSLAKVIDGLKEWGDYHRTSVFKRTIKTSAIPLSGKSLTPDL